MEKAASARIDRVWTVSALAAPVTALLLGAFLLLGAGFVPLPIAHNAAHDARHSFAFPCH